MGSLRRHQADLVGKQCQIHAGHKPNFRFRVKCTNENYKVCPLKKCKAFKNDDSFFWRVYMWSVKINNEKCTYNLICVYLKHTCAFFCFKYQRMSFSGLVPVVYIQLEALKCLQGQRDGDRTRIREPP